jgi:hypothetical protein
MQMQSQIQIRLYRGLRGILVNVQATELVEEFFKNIHPEQPPEPCQRYGRFWSPIREDVPLLAYSISDTVLTQPQMSDLNHPYTLQSLGGEWNPQVINLSMLRLQGISEGNGVTFLYHGIFGEGQLQTLAEQLHKAAARFYNSYLTNVDITLRIIKEEPHEQEAGYEVGGQPAANTL